MTIKSPLHVAVGLLFNSQKQILVAERAKEKHLGQMWEFPGGKIETGEDPYQALCRELKEEIGIIVKKAQPFLQLQHDYGELHVVLHVWRVEEFIGEPSGAEGQPIQWVSLEELTKLTLPGANQEIVKMIIEN